jgi:acyl-CoA thioester hydrolase
MKDSPRPSVLKEFPIVVELPIQWGDLDAFGHVNNLVYLRWFEAARAVYAMQVGVDVTPRQNGIGAILSAITCKYLRQLSFPGTIFAGVRVTRLSIGSVTLEMMIVDGGTGVAVAAGGCDVVLYDFNAGKPVPVPDPIHAAVEALEGRPFPL